VTPDGAMAVNISINPLELAAKARASTQLVTLFCQTALMPFMCQDYRSPFSILLNKSLIRITSVETEGGHEAR
jgi:hypothetical protein